MKRILILLAALSSVVLAGCTNLGETVECTKETEKRTKTVVGETNKRVLLQYDDGRLVMSQKSDWETGRSNCSKSSKEKMPPTMPSGYEQYSGYFK